MENYEIIRDIISQYPEVKNNRQKLRSVLLDKFQTQRVIANMFLMAYDEGIINKVIQTNRIDEFTFEQLSTILIRSFGITKSTAHETVTLVARVFNKELSVQTNNTPNASKNSTPSNQSPVTQTKNIRNWNPSLCKDFLYASNGHEVRINKYVGRGGHVVIPDYIDGNPVTSIAAEAFYGFESGKNVTGVELPCKLQYICSNAFAHMRNLKGIITLPQALQKIHDSAFSCTGINGLVIQSNCKIQYCAFYSNENLDFVYITEGCSPRIDSDAFSDNKHLKTVIIPRETTRIEERAFKLCNEMIMYTPNDSFAAEYGRKRFIRVDSARYETMSRQYKAKYTP